MAEAAAAPASISKRKKTKITPTVDDLALQPELIATPIADAEAGFAGSEELEASKDDFDLTEQLLKFDPTAADAPRGSAAVPPAAALLFAQDGAASRRPAWRYYALGLGAALLFLLLGFVVTKIMH